MALRYISLAAKHSGTVFSEKKKEVFLNGPSIQFSLCENHSGTEIAYKEERRPSNLSKTPPQPLRIPICSCWILYSSVG